MSPVRVTLAHGGPEDAAPNGAQKYFAPGSTEMAPRTGLNVGDEGGLGFRSFHARITDTRNRHNPKRGGRGIFVEPLVPTNHQPRRGGII